MCGFLVIISHLQQHLLNLFNYTYFPVFRLCLISRTKQHSERISASFVFICFDYNFLLSSAILFDFQGRPRNYLLLSFPFSHIANLDMFYVTLLYQRLNWQIWLTVWFKQPLLCCGYFWPRLMNTSCATVSVPSTAEPDPVYVTSGPMSTNTEYLGLSGQGKKVVPRSIERQF